MAESSTKEIDYEEGYHAERHKDHAKEKYYLARATIAQNKFFKDIPEDSRLLDYGCGLGQNIYLRKNAVGFDISSYGLDFCRDKGIEVTDDLDSLPDESFDNVFSAHVLEHHPNPKEMIANMRSKLKPGHDLLLVIPHERHAKADFELDINQHLFSWNFRSINNLLLSSGFLIKENKYLRGAGYNKLLSLFDASPQLYKFSTDLVSRFAGIKEMMIVATKK